jgi:DNA-binding HxlR family transcriptional regulator
VSSQEGTYLEPSDKDDPARMTGAAAGLAAGHGADGGADAEGDADAENVEAVRRLADGPGLAGAAERDAGGDADAEHVEADAVCTMISETLARIGDKWTVLVVELLCVGRGPVRFNEIRRSIPGISQRMLTLTLRGLERDGLVTRTVHPTIPPRVDYELTKLGQSLRVPLVGVAEWARANRASILDARKVFDATSTASPSSRQVRRRAPALLSRTRIARPRPV